MVLKLLVFEKFVPLNVKECAEGLFKQACYNKNLLRDHNINSLKRTKTILSML